MLAGTKVTRNGSFGPKAERIGPILRKHMKADESKIQTFIFQKNALQKHVTMSKDGIKRFIKPFMPGLEVAQICTDRKKMKT